MNRDRDGDMLMLSHGKCQITQTDEDVTTHMRPFVDSSIEYEVIHKHDMIV